MHDLVIRGGTVVDGAGGAPYEADVAITAGRIAAVGTVAAPGREEVDARGAIVTPGFVDVHTHYDGQITWENRLSPSTGHGVTTVVMGNCGVGFAPIRPHQRQLAIKLMEGVEDVPEVVMAEGLPWNWETFPDYLDALSARRADADFAALVPHSPLRVYVMGQRGVDLEPPTPADLDEMQRLTAEAVRAGAIGVSTSRSMAHRFRSGQLAPSVSTEEQELSALARGLRDAGNGMFQMIPDTAAPAEDEFGLMERLAGISGRPVSFSLLQVAGRRENWGKYLDALAARPADLPPIYGQFYPRPIGMLFGLDLSFHPFSLNPSYRPIAHLPLAEKVAALRDEGLRARLLAEEPDDPNPFFVQTVRRVDNLFVLGDPPNYHPAREDSLKARAERAGISLRAGIYEALLEDEGRAILYAPSTGSIDKALDGAGRAFRSPRTVVGLGDGGAHYGLICDAAFPTYVLTRWLKPDEETGLDLSEAVRALSRTPALSVGLEDRGLIAEGLKGDINVIDLARLRLAAPRIAHDLPAGGKRLTQRATGYRATILSGAVTYRDGEATGELPGRLIRKAA